ncbi:hypothetical protein [Methylobacterium sp. Leaf117]|uniref:hypothetical protein n=1 Tax=Methylobacterium sp. Leaf117 TaxID=1736260 RepID=UPI0012E10202|nr:hypothetical protein [Methylobacterium sp. Leaf117]
MGLVRDIDFLTGAGIQRHLPEAIHLLGLDAAGLAVPNPADAAVSEARGPRDPR